MASLASDFCRCWGISLEAGAPEGPLFNSVILTDIQITERAKLRLGKAEQREPPVPPLPEADLSVPLQGPSGKPTQNCSL